MIQLVIIIICVLFLLVACLLFLFCFLFNNCINQSIQQVYHVFFLHFIVLKPNSTVSRSFYKILSGSLSHRIGSWYSHITIAFISSAGCSTYSLLFLLLLWVTMRMYKKRSTAENIVPFLNDYPPFIIW